MRQIEGTRGIPAFRCRNCGALNWEIQGPPIICSACKKPTAALKDFLLVKSKEDLPLSEFQGFVLNEQVVLLETNTNNDRNMGIR